ncbi:hypothetical protein C8Q76DRAFT_691852 [Earliella scabrosa]|nr:hypothetical protein C8Q76DRAFT_691852 [Earliella scabrosa]
MPTYYVSPNYSHHRQRAYSHSYQPSTSPQVVYTHSHSSHHSSPGRGHHRSGTYSQPGAYYTTAPQYVTPNYQYEPSRHHTHGHHRTGSGGTTYYAATAPTTQYVSTSRHSPTHHHTTTTTRRSTSVHNTHRSRSQSVPRTSVRAVDYAYPSGNRLRRSESRPRPETSTRNVSSQRRSSHSSSEPLGDRIRRMFGFGGNSSSSHRDHRVDYMDPRSGRTVDWRGRPIYRV